MNSYGMKQLMKYGWTIGKGLGAEEDGITDAIKPKLKFCTTGFGHNRAEEFTYHWWDHCYNKASQNLIVLKNENGHIEIKKERDITISTKKPSKFKIQNGKGLYDYFIKGNILNGPKDTVINENKNEDESESEDENGKDLSSNLSDEQLFQICGGMTAHKGARHGLTMSAKLARLEKQEKSLQIIESPPYCSSKKLTNLKPILKENTPDNNNSKKRKSVQFNEDLRLKIFSYGIKNCDKEADISIKMEDDETPASTLALYVEEFSLENNIIPISFARKKKGKKKSENPFQNNQDIWELLVSSLQQGTNKSVGTEIYTPNLEAKNLDSLEQKENDENIVQTKKKKKRKLGPVSVSSICEQISLVGSKILNSSEMEVLGRTMPVDGKTKKKKKSRTKEVSIECATESFVNCDNSSFQIDLNSEPKKKRKKKKNKRTCSNDNSLEVMPELDTAPSNSVSSDLIFDNKNKNKLMIESMMEVKELKEDCANWNKKKKNKRKLEDMDVALELINVESLSPKKKKMKYPDK